MRFFVNKKSGFSSRDKLIVIYDKDGNIFYYKDNVTGLIKFNLPIGEYLTNNNLNKIDPVNYPYFNLPNFKLRRRKNTDLKESFEPNKNKASVDINNRIAIYDNSFKNAYKVCFDFVKCHEKGHFYFHDEGQKSEQECDMFAYNCLINHGYNPSQIVYAQKNTLSNSPDAQKRKNILFNHANKK